MFYRLDKTLLAIVALTFAGLLPLLNACSNHDEQTNSPVVLINAVGTDIPFSARPLLEAQDSVIIVAYHVSADTLQVQLHARNGKIFKTIRYPIGKLIGKAPSIAKPNSILLVDSILYCLYDEGIVALSIADSVSSFLPTDTPYTHFSKCGDRFFVGRFYDALYGSDRCVVALLDDIGHVITKVRLDISSIVMTRVLPCDIATFRDSVCLFADPLRNNVIRVRAASDSLYIDTLICEHPSQYDDSSIAKLIDAASTSSPRDQIRQVQTFLMRPGSSLIRISGLNDNSVLIVRSASDNLGKKELQYTASWFSLDTQGTLERRLDYISPGAKSSALISNFNPILFVYSDQPVQVGDLLVCLSKYPHDAINHKPQSAISLFRSISNQYQNGRPMTYSLFFYRLHL